LLPIRPFFSLRSIVPGITLDVCSLRKSLSSYVAVEFLVHFSFSLAGQGGASVTDRAITLLLRDGVMYYFLIFLVNLMNVLIYFVCISSSLRFTLTDCCVIARRT
jgi:hypothetical protein